MKIYQNYTTYVYFLYASIIVVYVCATTHSRLSTLTMVTLLLVNFFRLASFFTQGTLGITTIEFYVLVILFLLALGIVYIRYRIRYPLIIIVGVPFLIILLNHALPLYPDAPDFQGFYDAQTTTLHTQTKDTTKILQDAETKITITTDNTEKILIPGQSSEAIELGTGQTQIIFSSKTGIQNTYAYIIFPKGAIIELYPQSAIAMQETDIDIIQGKINVYTPQDQLGYFTLTGNLTKIILDDTGNIQNLIERYRTQKNEYFVKQIGGEIMLNPTIDAFIGRYLGVANSANKTLQNLSKYLPLEVATPSFDQNVLNYDEFHTYLEYQTHKTYEATTGSTQRIVRDTQKGWNATNTKGRRDAIQNTINNIFKK